MPEHPGDDVPEGALDMFSDHARDTTFARTHLRDQREVAWDEASFDPLLTEIATARAETLAAERKLRLLITHGCEFVEPRPYTLDFLATAADMSVSGVRTAYDDEILAVAKIVGAKLRRRDTDDPAETPTRAVNGDEHRDAVGHRRRRGIGGSGGAGPDRHRPTGRQRTIRWHRWRCPKSV